MSESISSLSEFKQVLPKPMPHTLPPWSCSGSELVRKGDAGGQGCHFLGVGRFSAVCGLPSRQLGAAGVRVRGGADGVMHVFSCGAILAQETSVVAPASS